MRCDWNLNWTTITYLKTFQNAKDFIFCYSLNCTKKNLLHKISLFKVLKINRFLAAQIGEVIPSLNFLWLLISSVKVKSLYLSCAHSLVTLNTSQKVVGGPLIFVSFILRYAVNRTPTHFHVVPDITPFLTGTRTHAPGLPGRDANHWTTIALILTFASTSYWFSHPISVTFLWNRFFCLLGLHYQPFSSLLHAPSFVRQSESSKPASSSHQPIRVQWRHSRLF